MKYWSAEETECLGLHWGKRPTRELAKQLGRTAGALKQRAVKLGLDAGRGHTPAELEAVRSLYSTHTAREIAERLYGTESQRKLNRVLKIIDKLKLPKWHYWPGETLDRVRALHADGLTDGQIARRMPTVFAPGDVGRLQARHIRRRLGLPANKGTESYCEASRQAVRNQMVSLGLANLNGLRKMAHERYAARYGLPPDLRPPQVRMVLALVNGPLTIPELKAAIGARPDSQVLHNEHCTTYQADLVHRGLLARIPTGIGGSTRGPRVRYLLTAACLDLLTSAPIMEPAQ
jgi:hypothetical protein